MLLKAAMAAQSDRCFRSGRGAHPTSKGDSN
jgi:hypothetical protein